jgi:hypothetical protein
MQFFSLSFIMIQHKKNGEKLTYLPIKLILFIILPYMILKWTNEERKNEGSIVFYDFSSCYFYCHILITPNGIIQKLS